MIQITKVHIIFGISTKKAAIRQPFLRGLFQTRTGVNGFADQRLATRPRDLFGTAKIQLFF